MLTNQVVHSVTMKIANQMNVAEEAALAQMAFITADAMLKAREA
jgi:hypothetical protein